MQTKTGTPGVSYERSVTNFILFEQAVDVDENMVAYSTPIYIRSAHNQWLHATTKTSIIDRDAKHRYVQLDFVDSKRDENAFSMQVVDLKDVQDLSWAKSDHISLQKMFAKTTDEIMLLGSPETKHELQEYTRALDSMLLFCTMPHKRRKPQEIANHQHTLADLRVEDELMTFLSRPFQTKQCQWRTLVRKTDGGGSKSQAKERVQTKPAPVSASEDGGGETCSAAAAARAGCGNHPLDPLARGVGKAVAEAARRDADADLISSLTRTGGAAAGKHSTGTTGTTESWGDLLTQPEMAAYNSLARRCYSIIREMCTRNAGLAYHIASKYKVQMMFQCQLLSKVPEIDWDIVTVLQEMYKDNALLIHALTAHDLQVYMELIQQTPSVRQHRMYIKLMSLMCANEKEAIVDAQDAIRTQLQHIIPRTRINAKDNSVEIEKLVPDLHTNQHIDSLQMAAVVEEMMTSSKDNEVWRSLEEFVESPENALYLVALTELLTNLCLDRRRKSQELIKTQFAPFKVALIVLKNRNINSGVRAGFVSLVRKLYVDVDPFESNPINLARMFSDVEDENGVRYLEHEIEKVLPDCPNWTNDLMDWCELYFTDEGPHLKVTDPEERFGAPGSLKRRRSSTANFGRDPAYSPPSSSGDESGSFKDRRRSSMESGSSRGKATGRRSSSMRLNSSQSISFTRKGWSKVKGKISKMNEDLRDANEAVGNNVLCCQILGLLGDMVRHGFCYDNERRVQLLDWLLDLLRKSARSKNGVLEDTLTIKARDAITSAKRAACELIFSLNKIWGSNVFLAELLSAFKAEYIRSNGKNLTTPTEGWIKHLPSFAEQSKSGGFLWFRQGDGDLAGSDNSEDYTDIEVVCILLDLCQYGDPKLTESSLRLLLASFNLKGEILQLLSQVTFTADDQGPARPSALAELRRRKTLWFTAVHKDVMSCFGEIRNLLEWFTAQLDQRLSEKTVRLHQKMLRGERIHIAVLQLLREQIGSKTSEELAAKMEGHPGIRQLLQMGFYFLGIFAANNETNQGEFVSNEVFHFLIGATSLGIGAEIALTEILNHSDAVRLVRSGIARSLVHNLFLYEGCRSPQYLEMLQVIVAPKGVSSEEQQTKFVSSITAARNMMISAGNLDSSIAIVDEELYGLPGYGEYSVYESLAMLWKPQGADEHGLPPTQDWLNQVAYALGRKAFVIEKLSFYIEAAKNSRTLVGDRVEPRTGARYKDVFFGSDFCQVLLDEGLADTRVEAEENGAACVAIGVIDRVDAGFAASEFVDGKILFRFRRTTDSVSPKRTLRGTKDFACEYYLSLARLISTLSEHNPYTRGILVTEAPFQEVLNPILSDYFGRLSTAAKTTYVGLAHTLHLYTLTNDELFEHVVKSDATDPQVNGDRLNDMMRGRADSPTNSSNTTATGEKITSFIQLITAISTVLDEAGDELTAWVSLGTKKGDWKQRKREAFAPDKYLMNSVLPFSIELLLHSAKVILQAWELGGDNEAKSWPLQALVSSLIERIIDFFQRRQRGPNMDPPDRQRGSALIEKLMVMTQSEEYTNVRSALFTGAFSGRVTARLEDALPWWRGEDEYAAQIIEEQAIAAKLDPSNESDRIANQMFAFKQQIKTMLMELGENQPVGDEMLWHRSDDSTDATFSEYWLLVRIFRKFFLEGADNSKQLEQNISMKRKSASFRKSAAFRQSDSFNSRGSVTHNGSANLRLSAHGVNPPRKSSSQASNTRRLSGISHRNITSASWKSRMSSHFNSRVGPANARKKWVPQKKTWKSFIDMFGSIFEYFRAESIDLEGAGTSITTPSGGLELANEWLRLLCALMSKEDASELASWNQRFVAKTLNSLGLPRLIISLMSKSKTASFAARLGTELCKCSPVETAIEEDPAIAVVHPHSQRAFYEHLVVDKKGTHQALIQFKHAVGIHIERLHRMSLGVNKYGVVDRNKVGLSSNGVKDVVEFLRYLCMGCYSNMQDLLLRQGASVSSINVLELITDLAHIHGKVIVDTLRGGFNIGSSPHSKAFPLFALKVLRTELHGVELLVQLYRLVTEVSCGPNLPNQDALVSLGIVEQMLPVLMYMEAGGIYAGKAIDDVVESCERDFAIWQREFGVTLSDVDVGGSNFECYQNYDDAHDVAKAVPTRLLSDVATLRTVLSRLGTVDEECETHIIAAVSALMEGRGSGHPTFDSVCFHLFGDVRSLGGVSLNQSTLINNLTSHYEKSVEDGTIDTHENGTSGASAMAYYVLLAQLGFNAHDYGTRVNEALELWNKELGFPFEKRVGRLELVQGNILISIYFPVPADISIVNNSAVVKSIKQSIIDETYLLNDQERVRSFLEHAPLVMKIIREQAGYRHGMVKRWLSFEGTVITSALVVSVVLNAMLISEFDVLHSKWIERHASWIALGMLHLTLCLLMAVTYIMNHITIDRYNYQTHMKKLPTQHGLMAAATLVGATSTFWAFQTRALYVFVNVVFSILGNFYDKGFFVLGMYGITGKVHGMGLITKAIFASTPKLMSTVGLAFVVLYTLAVIGETLYKGLYTWPDTETACENNGTDFATCFRDHIYTFGERAVFFQEIPNFGGFLFAVFYNLAVPFLLSGIVVGIITDTFGQLRQRAEEVSNAKQSYCYCCSHSRQELEHGSVHGFDGHVRFEHNPWDFVAFVVHAEEKYARHEHLTGPEMHALKLNIQHKLSAMWPFHRALCVDGPINVDVRTAGVGAGGAKGTLFHPDHESSYLNMQIRTGVPTKLASTINNSSSDSFKAQIKDGLGGGSSFNGSRKGGGGGNIGPNNNAHSMKSGSPVSYNSISEHSGGERSPAFFGSASSPSPTGIDSTNSSAMFVQLPDVLASASIPRPLQHVEDALLIQELDSLTQRPGANDKRTRSVRQHSSSSTRVSDSGTLYDNAEGRDSSTLSTHTSTV